MAWLNYHHLLYFWTVARSGTIAAASHELHLSQPTISTQLKLLEQSLGQPLFVRKGRRLVLNDAGKVAFRFADDIFRLGRELSEVLSRGAGQTTRFAAGIADVIPKQVAHRVLEPAFAAVPSLKLECHEGPLAQLLARLAVHELDVVLSDQPAPPEVSVRAFSHVLGESSLSFFAASPLAAQLRRGFPDSLHRAPLLLPMEGTGLRRQLDRWLDGLGLSPIVAGEFDDGALLKTFAASGRGAFAAPSVTEAEVIRQHQVQLVGRVDELRQTFYAISVERRLKHPAVLAVAEWARRALFEN